VFKTRRCDLNHKGPTFYTQLPTWDAATGGYIAKHQLKAQKAITHAFHCGHGQLKGNALKWSRAGMKQMQDGGGAIGLGHGNMRAAATRFGAATRANGGEDGRRCGCGHSDLDTGVVKWGDRPGAGSSVPRRASDGNGNGGRCGGGERSGAAGSGGKHGRATKDSRTRKPAGEAARSIQRAWRRHCKMRYLLKLQRDYRALVARAEAMARNKMATKIQRAYRRHYNRVREKAANRIIRIYRMHLARSFAIVLRDMRRIEARAMRYRGLVDSPSKAREAESQMQTPPDAQTEDNVLKAVGRIRFGADM